MNKAQLPVALTCIGADVFYNVVLCCAALPCAVQQRSMAGAGDEQGTAAVAHLILCWLLR